MMQKFELIIFRQSRVLTALFLTPFALIGCMIVGANHNNILLGSFLSCCYLLIAYYFVVGKLTVTIAGDTLSFLWKKKHLFNFSHIDPIGITDIHTLVIDNGQMLRKIKTSQRTILLNTTKVQQKDAIKLIYHLDMRTKGNNVRKMDSWEEWADKGHLKAAYKINTIVLILATCIVAYYIGTKGFSSKHLFFMLLLLPQLFLYSQQMKQTIKQDKQQ